MIEALIVAAARTPISRANCAAASVDNGWFDDEVVPVEFTAPDGMGSALVLEVG